MLVTGQRNDIWFDQTTIPLLHWPCFTHQKHVCFTFESENYSARNQPNKFRNSSPACISNPHYIWTRLPVFFWKPELLLAPGHDYPGEIFFSSSLLTGKSPLHQKGTFPTSSGLSTKKKSSTALPRTLVTRVLYNQKTEKPLQTTSRFQRLLSVFSDGENLISSSLILFHLFPMKYFFHPHANYITFPWILNTVCLNLPMVLSYSHVWSATPSWRPT